MAIEIVSFPINSMVIFFDSYVNLYQRVSWSIKICYVFRCENADYWILQATMDAKLDPCLGTCSISLSLYIYICIHTEYIRIHIYIIHRIYIYIYVLCIYIYTYVYIYVHIFRVCQKWIETKKLNPSFGIEHGSSKDDVFDFFTPSVIWIGRGRIPTLSRSVTLFVK